MILRSLFKITNDGGSLFATFHLRSNSEKAWLAQDCLDQYIDELAKQITNKLELQEQQSITAHTVIKLRGWQDSYTGEYDGYADLLKCVVFKKPKRASRRQKKLLDIYFKNRGQ